MVRKMRERRERGEGERGSGKEDPAGYVYIKERRLYKQNRVIHCFGLGVNPAHRGFTASWYLHLLSEGVSVSADMKS